MPWSPSRDQHAEWVPIEKMRGRIACGSGRLTSAWLTTWMVRCDRDVSRVCQTPAVWPNSLRLIRRLCLAKTPSEHARKRDDSRITAFDSRVGTRRGDTTVHSSLRIAASSGSRSETDILRHQAARAVPRWIRVSVLVGFRSSRVGGPRSQNFVGLHLSNRHPGSLDMTGRSSLVSAPLHRRTLYVVARSQPPYTTVRALLDDSSPAASFMAERVREVNRQRCGRSA